MGENPEKERKDIMKTYGKNILRSLSMALAFAVMISFVNVQSLEAKTKEKNIVVLYFSATGTTKGAAKKIGKTTKGTVIEIKAKDPYTDEDLDYGDENSRVSKEHASAETPAKSKVRPEIANIKAIKKAVKKADVVYIGYPIWWGEAPRIVSSFVESYDFSDKTIVPFCTSGGSGIAPSVTNLEELTSGATWLEGQRLNGGDSRDTVMEWVNGLGLSK